VLVLRRVDVTPGVEVLLGGGEAAEAGRVAAGDDVELVEVEQPRLPLAQAGQAGFLALVAVAADLDVSLVERVGREFVGLFALHRHQRDAVDEEDDVGDDEVLDPAGRVDAELVDGVEEVALRVLEVDQPDRGVVLAGALVAVDDGLDQQLLHRLVGLDQRAGLAGQLVVELVYLALGEPGCAVGQRVEGQQRSAEHLRQHELAEAGAQARCWIGRDGPMSLVDHLPAQGAQLVEEGLFDEVVFRHVAARRDWQLSSPDYGRRRGFGDFWIGGNNRDA